MCGGGGGGSDDVLEFQKEQDRRRQERREKGQQDIRAFFDGGVTSDGRRFEGFDEDFFQQRADAFEDFANPQVDNQFQDARLALMEGLANANLFDSTAANTGADQLQRDLDQGRDRVARRGQQEAQNAKQQVQRQRQNLTSLVQSGAAPGDLPLESAAQALDFADSFNPVGQLFEGTTRLVGGVQQGRRNNAIRSRVNNSFSSNPSSGSGSTRG